MPERRDWITCNGCETILQDDMDRVAPDTMITETIYKDGRRYVFSEYEAHFCDKACQVRFYLMREISGLRSEVNQLKEKIDWLERD